MIDGFYGLPPGATYSALVKRTRKWWQFWKPPTWHEWVEAVVPAPAPLNCKCTLAPHIEGEPT